MARTIGATDAVWLSRGLTRDYDDFGTNGQRRHRRDLRHARPRARARAGHAAHPDVEVSRLVRRRAVRRVRRARRTVTITGVPAPATLRDDEGWVD